MPADPKTTMPDMPDTADQIAFRRGKSAGYSEGIADGWDACMRHMEDAFQQAIRAATVEPEAVSKHRAAVMARRANQERATNAG